MNKDMKNENKFNLTYTKRNCKVELYTVGDNFAVEIIESRDGFIAWLRHADSWFSMAIVSSRKKEFTGTKLEFEVDHDFFLEMVQRSLPDRIDCFRKHCPIAEF